MVGQRARSDKAIDRPPKIDSLRLPKQLERNERLDAGFIDNSEPYLGFEVNGGELVAESVRFAAFRQGRFVDVDFSETHLVAPDFTDVRFERCNLANARWEEMAGRRIELINCRLTGFVCSDARLQHTVFRDCTMDLANFRFAVCSPVRFDTCQMAEADFLGADLSSAVVHACDLSRADLSRAKLIDVDLRGSRLEGTRLGEVELRGARVDLTQVVIIAEHMGLRVDLG